MRKGELTGQQLERTEGRPVPSLPQELAKKIILEADPTLESRFSESEAAGLRGD